MRPGDRPRPGLLHNTILIAAFLGAVGSLTLTFLAGQHQRSKILLLLFAVWVLSPFVVVVFALRTSKRWAIISQASLYTMTLALTVCSLTIYGAVTLGYVRAKIGFVFLAMPLVSWLVMAIVFAAAVLLSRKLPGTR